jgi:hypothetical protein
MRKTGIPGERVMYPLHKLEVIDGISPQSRCKWHRELFKVTEILSEVNARDIVHNVEQSHTSTGIAGSLSPD